MGLRHFFGVTLFALVSTAPAELLATTELPLRFGARSLGMGGTGVAFVDDPTAIAINPARLDRVERWAAQLTLSPFIPRSDVPFSRDFSQPGRNQETKTVVVPLFFAGAGVRVLDPLTTGAALYLAAGVGARYDDLPEYDGLDMTLDVAVIEAALPLSYRVSEKLALGVALRFAQAFVAADMPLDVGASIGALRAEMDLTGNAFPGVLAGVSYMPAPDVALGFAYRSKMTIELEGDGTATQEFLGEQPLHIDSEWSTAHQFRLGSAWWAVPERLLLALDVTYTMLDDANDVLPLELRFTEIPDTTVQDEISFHWKDSVAALVGAEYLLADPFLVRAGYHIASSGTPEAQMGPLVPPHGVIHTAHLGAGLRTDHIRADLGGAYAFGGGGEVTRSVNGPPGDYGGDYWLLSGSFTYLH